MEMFGQEETLEDFYKSSQENLNRYSLFELLGPHFMKGKNRHLKEYHEQIQEHPYSNLFCNHLENLSVKQAEVLSQFAEWKETKLHLPSQNIILNGLQQIDESVAKALAPFKGSAIILNGLQKIDEPIAKALASYQCQVIVLDKIEELDDFIAQILSEFKGEGFSFNGLKHLNESTAKLLAKFNLSLNGLVTLEEDVARVLAFGKGRVVSLGVDSLDVNTAKALSFLKKTVIHLDHLKHIDASVAKYLAQAQFSCIYLNGLKKIDEAVAIAFASFQGNSLFLDGLQELDVSTAKALASFKGSLSLNGLAQLEGESAQALAYFETDIPLIELEKVPKEEFYNALALIKESGQKRGLHLEGLHELYEETAKGLTYFKGQFLFLGITRINKQIASLIASFSCDTVFLDELEEIDESVARALTSFQGKRLFLTVKRIEESVSAILTSLRPKVLFHVAK